LPQVFRIAKRKHADGALEGLGAKRHGGRWNSRGVPVVYGSDCIALAALELLVHLRRPEILTQYQVFQLELTDDQVLGLAWDGMPPDWRDDPPPPSTAEIGDEWLDSSASLALAVPSVVVPQQLNFLLNPGHPAYKSVIEQVVSFPFDYDPRLG